MSGTAVVSGCVTSMASMSSHRVIVVEDEILIRLPVVSALEAADFVVIEAGDAGEALVVLQREAGRVHVVFTDVHIPGQMDGLMLAHHVRQYWPHIALLVTSGRSAVEAGAMPEGSRFIPKPYHLDHVVHHVRELTARLN
jgi:two-component system, response regulator PdtaR